MRRLTREWGPVFENSRDHIWKLKVSAKEISPLRRLEISTLDTKIQAVDRQLQSGKGTEPDSNEKPVCQLGTHVK